MPEIRTPDQRLRVFISSTLGELAPERLAVARAVSALRLTPVMFETGARPQVPADVYRAYLAQSDVFIGLYWQRYGEPVPGLTVSGLEEEYERSRGKPRLLYLKTPAPERDPRLADLVTRIGQDASYRRFRTPTELGRLVRDDLAQLLSDRFTARRSVVVPETPRPRTTLPLGATTLVGREHVIDDVATQLTTGGRRLVTLHGPGGIGKTRLAVAVAERLRERFDAGTVFVPLADVSDPGDVVTRIGWALGADVATGDSPWDTLADLLADGTWLLVLDNLERLVAAAPEGARLLDRSPGVAVLATSTTVLGVRAEHPYPVPPLPVGSETGAGDGPAVMLFLERARAARPGFTPTPDDLQAVREICRRLEGHPLAIELAAARVRLLDPPRVLERLARSLDALGAGMADHPERQRTLRATVEWSIDTLGPDERELLEHVAVFADGWFAEAVAAVADCDEDRALELVEALARHSLVQVALTPVGPRARLPHAVRSFVAERLADRPDAAQIHGRHAAHYRARLASADRSLRGLHHGRCAEALALDNANITAAVRWHLEHDPEPLPQLLRALSPFRVLWPFLGVGDAIIGETRGWIARILPVADALDPIERVALLGAALVSALEAGDAAAAGLVQDRLAPALPVGDAYLDAVSMLLLAWSAMLVGDVEVADRRQHEARARLRELDEPMWFALALLTSAATTSMRGRMNEARGYAAEAQRLAARFDHPWLDVASGVVLGRLAAVDGRVDEAHAHLGRALDLSRRGASTHGLGLTLDGVATVALAQGDARAASRLVGAAEGLRRRAALHVWAWMRQDARLVAHVRATVGADDFDRLFEEGLQLRRDEAIALAHEVLRSGSGTVLTSAARRTAN